MASLTRRASDVRINEVDLSSSIVNNSNATAAMAVVSSQGPVNPTYYSDFDTFSFDFGPPTASVSFDHYCARDYFLEGNSFWASRTVGLGAKYGAALVKNDVNGVTTITGIAAGVTDPTDPDWAGLAPVATDAPLYLISPRQGPGSYASKLAVNIISAELALITGVACDIDPTNVGSFVAGDYEYYVAPIGRDGEALASVPVTVTITAADVASSVRIDWNLVPNAIGYYVYGRTVAGLGRMATLGANINFFIDIGAITPDATHQPITSAAGLPTPSGLFVLQVFDLSQSATKPIEDFTCSVTEQTDETGQQMEITQRVNPYSRYIRVESNVFSMITVPVVKSVTTAVALIGGLSGAAPTSADINNTFNQFLNKELYTIDVFIGAGRGATVQLNMENVARTRYDAVAFGDVPSNVQTTQEAVDWRNLTLNLNSSFAAVFCSDLLESDPISGKILYVPPSGAMAGLYARTSRIAQPWFSIAGLNRGLLSVLGVRNTYDDGQATQLSRAQINYMRKFVGKGIPLWEQSTLYNKNSALQFLNVRFLCNIIKRSTYDYLLYGLQEPGDDILRKQLQFSLEEYLKLVKATRGISSYRVVITDTNNPPSKVNAGILSIAIIIVPILAVREIDLTLVISKEGLTVTEAEIASFA